MTTSTQVNLKLELMRRGLVNRQVADDMGITKGYLSKLINGHQPWTRPMALAFCAVTGIPLADVLREPEKVAV